MTAERRDREKRQSRLEFDAPLRAPSSEDSVSEEAPFAGGIEEAEALEDSGLASLPLFPETRTPPDSKPGEDDEGRPRREGLPQGRGGTPSGRPAPVAAAAEEAPEREAAADSADAVTVASRLLAGLADLAILGAVVALLLVGQTVAGTGVSLSQLPAYAVFLVAFSFIYTVVPLAFWGQTPGMSAVGLAVFAEGDEKPTFGQTAIRWGAGVLTACLLGLPLLVALSGRSLGDRLSATTTVRLVE